MKKTSKNETAMLDLIKNIQAQLMAIDKKVDTLIERSRTQAKPAERPLIDRNKERVMYSAVCADCQKECKIPFKPSGDRPVYCQDCFSRRKVINMSGISTPKPVEVQKPKKPVAKKKAAPKKK